METKNFQGINRREQLRLCRVLLYPLNRLETHVTLPVSHIKVINRASLFILRRRLHINTALNLTNMSKPSILLIPGSFALPEFYNSVVDAVVAKGYEIRALHLPSVGLKTGQGREGELPTMYDDAAFIAKEAERLADEGKEVILIGHSYGGVPVTQSPKGLGAKERQMQGKLGGIVSLAYITSLVPAVGTSAAGVVADVPKEHQLDLKIDVRFSPFSFLPLPFSFIRSSLTSVIGTRLDVPRPALGNCCSCIVVPFPRRRRGLDQKIPQALRCQLRR